MNNNILCLSIGLCLCAGGCPVMAQKASSGTVTNSRTSTKEIEVKGYKSFQDYEQKYFTADNLQLADIHVDKDFVNFANKKRKALKKSKYQTNEEVAFLSSDKKRLGIFNRKDASFITFDEFGGKVKEIVLSQFPARGVFVFSDTRIFAISPSFDGPGGFEIFSSTGLFIKWVDAGDIEGYSISSTNKYFAVTTLENDASYFKLLDLDGNILWKCPIARGAKASITFSSDDRYALIRLPEYWVRTNKTPPYKSVRKANKLYVVDIANQRLISEENYGN